ncbi:MAG: ferritin-like domain-containing protein [Clostridia bacterium]|nr:MAG: ferritin-like domain-containing protein [Clostridia bacterium]
MNQVDLYTAQSKRQEDIYTSRTLERVAAIEQQHVDNIAAMIKKLGANPTRLGDVIAPLTGQIAGKLLGLAGTVVTLKADIKLEEKAMQDYKTFLLHAGGHEELFKLLWNNLIDEDLHTAWFANKVRELERWP